MATVSIALAILRPIHANAMTRRDIGGGGFSIALAILAALFAAMRR